MSVSLYTKLTKIDSCTNKVFVMVNNQYLPSSILKYFTNTNHQMHLNGTTILFVYFIFLRLLII